MSIRFTKMHGIGNDYVYVNCFEECLNGTDLPALARAVSDRHCGIGSDGLILIAPPEPGIEADVRMEMYNADGSRSEMCGNGIRCVAKYAVDHRLGGHVSGDTADLRVQTDRGVFQLRASISNGAVDRVRVDMGPPILRPADIPVDAPGDRCVDLRVPLADTPLTVTCASLGNPHAVAFVDSLDEIDLGRIGPLVEHHALFPKRVNFHVAKALSRNEVTMRTWERGSGITRACGTGACAVLVAGVLEDRLDRSALIHLPGGDLTIEWPEAAGKISGSVFKTGPATFVYSGTWPT